MGYSTSLSRFLCVAYLSNDFVTRLILFLQMTRVSLEFFEIRSNDTVSKLAQPICASKPYRVFGALLFKVFSLYVS